MSRAALISAAVLVTAATSGAGGVAFATEPTTPQNQSATVLGPVNPQLSEGATALDSGHIEEGIRLTLEGLKFPTETHDKAAGYSNLCAGYAMLKQWDEALQHCNTSLALDPNNWRSYNNRAAVYVGKGQYDRAMDDLRAGLELAPNSNTLLESLRIVQENRRLVNARSRSAVRTP
jgi:tetratricopeptide (TPR) repeat protein